MNSEKEIAFEPENEFGAKSIGFFQSNKVNFNHSNFSFAHQLGNKRAQNLVNKRKQRITCCDRNPGKTIRSFFEVNIKQQMLSSFGIKPENVELFDDLEKSPEVRNLIRIQHGVDNPVLTCGNTILGVRHFTNSIRFLYFNYRSCLPSLLVSFVLLTISQDLETLKTAYTPEDLKKLVVGNEQGLLNVEESTTSLPTIGFAHQIVDGVKKVTSMINPFAYFNGPPTYTHPDKVCCFFNNEI